MSITQIVANPFEIGDPEKDLIGRGGMGDVYRGTDTQTGETVAIKALKPDVVANHPDIVARFIREGEALRQLNHPNIVKMVDAVEEGGRHYLVMEYIAPGSLRDLLEVLNHPSVEVDSAQVAETVLAGLRKALPTKELEAAMERGKTLELDAVVAELLAELGGS